MCKLGGCIMNDDPGWKWDGPKEITLATVLLVLIVIVAILALWNYLTLKRRREEAAVRRDVLLVAQRADAKEARRVRRGLIQEALISSTAADCECTHPKNDIRRTFSTVTLVTENMSVFSCDIENQESLDAAEPSRLDEDNGGQMCPICLEEYTLGDNISWSRYQKCRHAFHKNCIEGWLKQLDREGCCPFCRGPYLKRKELDEKDEFASDVDVESQHAIAANYPVEDRVREETSGQKNQNSDVETSPQQIDKEASDETTCKVKAVYNSFCIVHGLLR